MEEKGTPGGEGRGVAGGGPWRRLEPWNPLLLLALVLAVYGRALLHPYSLVDDPAYVTGNPAVLRGLSVEGVRWAFSSFHVANWHPLAWLSHMADVSLFGPGPAGPHGVNVLLHGGNGALLYAFLLRATGSPGRSLLAAALFAVHPLAVESVAWVAERKDLLCALFWLLGMHAYLRHARRPSAAAMGAVTAFHALALLSKPMAVTFPFALLLLDGWPLRRARGLLPPPGEGEGEPPVPTLPAWRLLAEKGPLFLLSAAVSVVTVAAQRSGGAVAPVPFDGRAANALLSYGRYLGKALWPAKLSVFYPHPWWLDRSAIAPFPWGEAAAWALLLALLVAAALRFARRAPCAPVGLAWFLGTLVPVIGLVQVGGQGMADRYFYLPGIGLFLAVAFLPLPPSPWARRLLPRAGAAAVAALAVAASLQLSLWRENTTLLRHAAESTRGNFRARSLLAGAMLQEGDPEGAAREAALLVQEGPWNARGWSVLCAALHVLGRDAEAVEAGERAVSLDGALPEYRHNLGLAYLGAGRLDEAAASFRESLARNPEDPSAAAGLAEALARGAEGAGGRGGGAATGSVGGKAAP